MSSAWNRTGARLEIAGHDLRLYKREEIEGRRNDAMTTVVVRWPKECIIRAEVNETRVGSMEYFASGGQLVFAIWVGSKLEERGVSTSENSARSRAMKKIRALQKEILGEPEMAKLETAQVMPLARNGWSRTRPEHFMEGTWERKQREEREQELREREAREAERELRHRGLEEDLKGGAA